MFMLPQDYELLLYSRSVDFRKSINGLTAILLNEFDDAPVSGKVYVFFNHGRNKLKALYLEKQGYCLWQKRIDKRCFRLPVDLAKLEGIDHGKLTWLRLGLDLRVFEAEAAKELRYFY